MAQPAYQLDWNLIRTFTAVAGEGSLAGAARVLALTYPTVARHIQQLEDSLHLTLFDRTSAGMVPTAAGRRLAANAQDMRTQALAFETQSDALRTEPGGTVRITCSEFLTQLAPSLLNELRNNADCSSAVIELLPSPLQVNLLEHDADIALRHARPTQADLVCRRVGDIELTLWAQREYLDGQSDLDLVDYIDGITHNNLQRGAERMGLPIATTQIKYRSDCVWSQVHAARAGWGVVVLPTYLGAQYAELANVPTDAPIPSLPLWLVARKDMRENPLHRCTFDALATSIKARFDYSGDTATPMPA